MSRTFRVPLDGSPLAERALPFAEALVRPAWGRLVLVRAVLRGQLTEVAEDGAGSPFHHWPHLRSGPVPAAVYVERPGAPKSGQLFFGRRDEVVVWMTARAPSETWRPTR